MCIVNFLTLEAKQPFLLVYMITTLRIPVAKMLQLTRLKYSEISNCHITTKIAKLFFTGVANMIPHATPICTHTSRKHVANDNNDCICHQSLYLETRLMMKMRLKMLPWRKTLRANKDCMNLHRFIPLLFVKSSNACILRSAGILLALLTAMQR